ncbi:hypothetical protein C8J57DRAFT_1370931 [Mycena rebaudengoi]|nr:hypothetical protein C8J57DRAFT_1370931 [Mycena rebaudengoi]
MRYVDKLQQPYSQYVLIRKAVRRPFIHAALCIPLHIVVLPAPDASAPLGPPGNDTPNTPAPRSTFGSMSNFETRVRSYLEGALHSISPGDASNEYAGRAIDSYWQKIQTVLAANQGQLPALLEPHCECILLRHHLDLHLQVVASSTPYSYIGVSKLSCFQCALYFQAYNATGLGPPLQTRGSRTKVFACNLPACDRGRDNADAVIEKELATQLLKVFGRLLAADVEAQYNMFPPPLLGEISDGMFAQLSLHAILRYR